MQKFASVLEILRKVWEVGADPLWEDVRFEIAWEGEG
jgi:hypothetical protein